ncbi:MAG: Cof-type HAD-IIB family hydrolase [Candidatus Fimenecus sp.]
MEKPEHQSFTARHPELWKFIKFNICIVVTTALDLCIYMFLLYNVFDELNAVPVTDNALLHFMGIEYKGYLYSYAISTTVGYVAAYLINRKLTFHSDVNAAFSSFLYVLMVALTIMFDSWLGSVVGTIMVNNGWSTPLTEIIAKCIIINVPTIWTYPLERFVIQRQRKPKIRLFATDLDGTLLHDDGTVSPENLCAMEKVVKKGAFVVPTTGRSFYEIPEILRTKKPYTHCICSNGAVCFDRDGKVLFEHTFPAELTNRIFAILSEYDTMIEIYADGIPKTEQRFLNKEAYDYFRIEENYHTVMDETRKGYTDSRSLLNACESCTEMFNIFFRDDDERKEAFERIGAMPEVVLTTSMQSNMEILQANVTKGSALMALCKQLKVKKSRCVAMGDSRNDLTMFEAVGTPLAVENACDELKKLSAEVICSNEDNAFAYAVEKYLKRG